MARFRVEITANAQEHLENIAHYYAVELEDPQLASRQTDRLLNAIASAAVFPDRYSIWPATRPDAPAIRYFREGPFICLIAVDHTQHAVSVLAILHGRRNIDEYVSTTLRS